VTKEEHRECQNESLSRFGHPFGTFLCAPLEKVLGVSATSGTTGMPTFCGFTKHDIRVTNEVLARGFWRAGVRPGETVAHAFGMSMWVAGIPIIRALENMGARVIPVGAEAGSERLLQFIEQTKPTTLLCTPSYAEYLIEKAPPVLNKDVGQLGIKKIICAGEPGAGLPEVRKKIREAYGGKLFDSSGVPFGIFNISCDCDEYHGLHAVCEDYHLMDDIVDPETKKPIEWKEGAMGERIATSLEWEAAPPFRYTFGDIIQIFMGECQCGVWGLRIKYVGRIDDMLIIKGINVFPSAIRNVISSFIPKVTGPFKIILDNPPPRVIPPLKMKVECCQGLTENDVTILKAEIEEKMSNILRFRPSIEFVPPESLERTAGKVKLFEKRY
ncbi:MAG TPA: phenylacetate--CoA ligase family protein, partial [candidate division Zixibacteria bacterium]